jgi:hypothetical protein
MYSNIIINLGDGEDDEDDDNGDFWLLHSVKGYYDGLIAYNK